MPRSATAAAVLLAVTGTVFAQSADAPPSTPANFRATLYDKAGGELFWQRSTDDRGAVRGYEITRNGQSLGIRDALSFYDPSLQPDTPYIFTVVAIDNAGQRSSVATTTLGGGTTSPSASGGPDAPDELRSDVYSKRSAELFWKREPAALALRYEIRRDGQVVDTTNGVSYYTDALAAGTGYAFEVIAIDRDGRRSSPSSITVRTDGDGPTTPPVASGPDAPDGLRSDVYSGRSAELFWQREPAALALRYEIRRDGTVVGTTNGVSYYTDALAAGTDYAFDVVAIDRGDRRSTPSTITVRTDGGSTPTPPALAAPANLRSSVYSSTNAELFWDRAATPGLRYEVTRDGESVGTTNGTSFYDDALASGTDYRYEVVAIDRQARRSAPATATLRTSGSGGGTGGAGTIIDADNRETILEEAFGVVSGEPFAEAFAIGDRLLGPGTGGLPLTLVAADTPDRGETFEESYECPGGGRFDLVRDAASSNGEQRGVASACLVGETLLDGVVSSDVDARARRGTLRLESFSLSRGDTDRLTISGSRSFNASAVSASQSYTVDRYEAVRDGERTLVTEASADVTTFGSPEGQVDTARARATVSAPWTDDRELSIETGEEFIAVPESDSAFVSGTLSVLALDGSELQIEATVDMPASFDLSVDTGTGRQTFDARWSRFTGLPTIESCVFGDREGCDQPTL